jgi:hypothetical protein
LKALWQRIHPSLPLAATPVFIVMVFFADLLWKTSRF